MSLNRGKKLFLNTLTSSLLEIVTIICGFVLPRIILSKFGSETNGLVNSITHFLGFISFLNLGVGAVMQSALYKPLAENDRDGVSRIVASGQKFYTKIAIILIGYVAVLAVAFPLIRRGEFGYFDVSFLVVAMSVNLFAQYFFGLSDRLLLTADQKGYIQYTAHMIVLILNTVACVIIIKLGASIQIVKLTTSVIFFLQPLLLHFYVNKRYKINRKIKYEGEPIKQKWNGLAQHVSAVVWENTDVAVLTVCSDLLSVSVYSVYYMVIGKLKALVQSMSSGVMALLGNQWAKKEDGKLRETFLRFQWATGFITVFVFGCAAMLIVPFIEVYTSGIRDADYIRPAFGYLLTAAMASYCLCVPYRTLVLVAGEYKRTQHIYIITAVLNVVISTISVFFWGLVGVAIGTLATIAYQMVAIVFFNNKHIIKNTTGAFIKQMSINVLSVVALYFSTFWIKLGSVTYGAWFVMAIEVALIAFCAVFIVNALFYGKYLLALFKKIIDKISKRKTGKRGTIRDAENDIIEDNGSIGADPDVEGACADRNEEE